MIFDPTAAGLTARDRGDIRNGRALAGSPAPRARPSGSSPAIPFAGSRRGSRSSRRPRTSGSSCSWATWPTLGPCGTSQAQYPRLTRRSTSSSTAQPSTPQRTVTDDGFETMFATNVLGPFLLTNLLLDRLRGGRVGPGLHQRAIDRQARLRRPPERAALQIADRLWRNEGGRPSVHVRARPPTRRHWRHRQRRPSWSRSDQPHAPGARAAALGHARLVSATPSARRRRSRRSPWHPSTRGKPAGSSEPNGSSTHRRTAAIPRSAAALGGLRVTHRP